MSNLEIVDIKNNIEVIKNEIVTASQVNMINGLDLDDFIYHKFLNRIDPVEYCEDVLRAHLPKSRQKLHENQTALIRAVCNPKLKQVAGMMSRQCIAKGSMIHTRDGKIIPIEKHPDAWLTRENADILQVKVKGGHIIYCTNNHPIMTADGWKRVDELTKKDWVCCLYSWDKFGDGKIPYHFKRSYIEKQGVFEMNDELAELCGYMTADGYFAKGQSCKFTNKNPHYISRVEQIVTKHFKDIIVKHKNNGNCDVIYFVTEKKDAENSFKDFISIMQYDKTRIPYAMNYFTKSQVSAFFRGIFSGDGWISKKIRRGRVIYDAGLSAKTSLQYAEFLRENLNKLGIRGQIKKEWFKKSTQYHYRICISGQRNRRLFLENIGEIIDKPFPNVEYMKGENPIRTVIGEDGEILYFSPVISVKNYGKSDVYDVTYHNKGWFLCGGMKVHNSGKTESISSFCGYLIDNYPMMRVGIFTPRLQQAEVSIGRLSTFFQMNEDRLNNKIVKITKDIVELDNGSYVTAVSASDQSNIEGLTFDVIVLDEAQKVSDYTFSERILPMGGGTNAKIVQVGTPKTRNHFYDAIEGKAKDKWTVVKRDWTQTPQNWLLEAIYLPDPKTGKERPYSRFIVETAMPKILKEQMFPNNPEVWTEGNLSVEDFKTQYMLEFIDGAGKFITSDDVKILTSGEYSWLDHGIIGEHYVAGIDFAGSNPDGDSTQITVLRITRDGIKQKVFAKEFNDASYPEQMYYISNLFGGYRPRFECKKIFADYTGCGAAVVQTLQEEFGLKNIEGIIFNARDKYTNSGMNLKNAMYGKWRQEFDNKKFQYPTKERFCESKADGAGAENLNYYHRMVGEWADLEQTTTGYSVNKKIEASSGSHDDVCDADVLANFAAVAGQRSSMPKPTRGRFRV